MCLMIAPYGLFAQNFTQSQRSFVASPVYLGMGGAGIALPKRESAFFYNPAGGRDVLGNKSMRFTILGVRTGISTNTIDIANFIVDRVQPTIDSGFDTLSEKEQEDLYDDALALFQKNGGVSAESNLLLPAFSFRLGSKAALNLGLFSDGKALLRVEDGGVGVPQVKVLGQADVVGVGGFSVNITPDLSAGVNAKFTARNLFLKDKPLDGFSAEEPVYAVKTNGISADVGLMFRPKVLKGLQIGAVVYDAFNNGLTTFSKDNAELMSGTESATELDQNLLQAAERKSGLSYRLGLGYTKQFSKFLALNLAADYEGYQNPMIEQDFGSKLYFGAEARLLRVFNLRAGFGQGYAAFGGGLDLGGLTLDYAYYGVESGRFAGQTPQYNHLIQLVLGSW